MSQEHPQRILQARGIRKTFPGVVALDNVDLDVEQGSVNAIVGENGAGKSTLIKILSGIYQEYEGTILLDGQPIVFHDVRDSQDKGIAVIHQELNLVDNLSVAENVFLGREYVNSFGMIDYHNMHDETAALLCNLDPSIAPDVSAAELRVGQQQIVEIAKALSLNARIIIMDEPTSAISEKEVEVFFTLIRALKQNGVTIIYITHKFDELDKIADRVSVLRDGKYIGSAAMNEVTHDDIIRMMVGRDLADISVKEKSHIQDEIIRIEHIRVPHPTRTGDFLVDDISLSLKKGEILGIFGLMGAGRTELCNAVFGVYHQKFSGRIIIEGKEVAITCPADAIDAGIGYVPEDRKHDGVILDMTIAENISMASIPHIEQFGLLNQTREQNLVGTYVRQLNIKAPGTNSVVETLSGGNQQKVVIAKWLATHPKVLLLDEPTRGIDIGAKKEIYNLIHALAAKGLGIIMVSSELPEILAVSDRILTLSEGTLTGEFTCSEATEELLLEAAILHHRAHEQEPACHQQ